MNTIRILCACAVAGVVSTSAAVAQTGSGSSVPALVTVNLQNVANNLSVSLNVSQTNIPATAQVPIAVAANVCGVSVNALQAMSTGGNATCTAKTASPQLAQVVQQQIAVGGNLGGGAQGGASASTGSGSASGGGVTGGSTTSTPPATPRS